MVCQEYQELMPTPLENERSTDDMSGPQILYLFKNSNFPAFEVSDMGGAHLFQLVMLHIPDYYYVRYLETQSFFL